MWRLRERAGWPLDGRRNPEVADSLAFDNGRPAPDFRYFSNTSALDWTGEMGEMACRSEASATREGWWILVDDLRTSGMSGALPPSADRPSPLEGLNEFGTLAA